MNVVAVVSAKGGVGKTTLAANLASVLAGPGRRVIALDLDPQNALRLHFGMPLDSIDGISRATLAHGPWHGTMFDAPDGVTVLPYGVLNEDDRRVFEQRLDAEPELFAEALDALSLEPSDIVLIDTPPGASVYTRAALMNAQFALNVVLPDAASYAAIPLMERLIDAYAAPRPDFLGFGYVINQADQSRQLAKDVVKVLRGVLGAHLYPGVVHEDQGVGEALAYDTTVIHYDPLSLATADFRKCGEWLLGKLTGRRSLPRSAA
ncbi:cellulose synthase operon protein YhjQ [Trinickia terrae]|uniref:Cellulose synthase operon protein YhjQ n=1 Tax=Trinickia terrae TaxID=2571161 RepID=A0A4U1HP01_9BURK|nr:cellulose biosynthesis protein BcsQ [Trinickia terrae]TKC81477.1 cellulose synthase operon protein YhjQ [Trinickia terrae]